MDNEQQKDELTALESIYRTEEFSYHSQDNKYEVISKIFVPLPENYFFTYTDSDKNFEKPKKVSISHLPPISLLLNLPSDYPSVSPPKFMLRSSWLSPVLLSKLCKKLDQLWEDNKGQEILFTWIGFLQTEILEFLNIQEFVNINSIFSLYKTDLVEDHNQPTSTSTIQNGSINENLHPLKKRKSKVIKKMKKIKSIDERAVTDILIDKNPVQMLIDYNIMRNTIEFRKNFYTCKICFTDILGENCLQFLPCSHVFCKECIVNYFVIKIKDGTVMNIYCPEEKCKSEATPTQIKELVSPELFSKYDSILLSTTLDSMVDIIYCPRKGCQYPVSREPNENMAKCPICQYVFCTFCKAVYHGIEPCKVDSAEKKKIVEEYKSASDERKAELELRYGKKQLQKLVDNSMSEDWISQNSQNCPNCHAAIEKSDGCNKMTCWKCDTFFCWKCKKQLQREDPYSHYRDRGGECFNALFHVPESDSDDEYGIEFEEFV